MKQDPYADSLPLSGDASYAFSEFEQLLVSNSGEDAFDVAVQLLTAKLFDERDSTARSERFTLAGSPREVHERINSLYKRAVKTWPDLGTAKQSIDISPEQLVRCLRPLVGWRILDSDLSHMDAAFERLVARDAKGSLGQYFTPRDVIRMCVVALSPSSSDRIIDPACGSGAFLYEAIKYARERGEDSPRCLGIDLGQRSVRVARLISHAVDPSAMLIHRGNSIDGRAYTDSPPQEWSPFLPTTQPPSVDRRPWRAWHDLTCDLLLTNPPFAGEIDDPGVIAVYESQRSRGAFRKGSVGREHLFVERAVQILAPGGRLAIVVPQGILANSTSSYLRKWVMERCRVLAVVGLHPFSFLPYTGVKTSVLFLEKIQPGAGAGDYPIAFVTSRNAGKDSSGRVVAKSDYPAISATLAAFFVREKRAWAKNGSPHVKSGVETVRASEVSFHDRLDAEYYGHDIRSLYFDLQSKSNGCIGDRVARNIERFNKTRSSEIDYVDISSVDSRSGVALPSRMDATEAPSRASYVVQPGDVLVSTVRPERNVVALVTKTSDVPVIASNGFCLLRAETIPPELVFAFCKTEAFRRLLSRRATASMYPAASDRDVLEMPFVVPSEKAKDSIVAKVREGLAMMEAARASISSAVTEMETAISAAMQSEVVRDTVADSSGSNGVSSARRRKRQVEDRNQTRLAILQS